MKKNAILLSLLVLAVLALSACAPEATPEPASQAPAAPEAVIAEGRILPRQDASLAFTVRGRVAEILVAVGDRVTAGQVLARLGDREQAEAAVSAAGLELVSAQQAHAALLRTADLARAQAWQAYQAAQALRAEAARDWEDLDLDRIDEQIDDAESEVQAREEDLADAQEEFDKYKDLNSDNPRRVDAEDALELAQEDYNEAVRKLEALQRERDSVQAAFEQAVAAEAEAKYRYEATLQGADADQLALLDARLAYAEAQLAAAQALLDQYELRAPFAGTVTDLNLTVGEVTGPEARAAVVASLDRWFVETSDLTELEVVRVSEGQLVQIKVDALPDLTLSGTVESISPSFKVQGGDILYTVHISLDEGDERLRWGMTVEISFSAE